MTMNETRFDVLTKIDQERNRQDDKWGFPQRNNAAEWGIILAEEFGEVAKEINDLHFRPDYPRRLSPLHKPMDSLKTELIQLAAVAVAIVEHIENGVFK